MKLNIIKDGETASVDVEGGVNLADALSSAGVYLPRECGGRGVCGKCAVEASGGLSPRTGVEEGLPDGVRLACKANIIGDCTVILHKTESITGLAADAEFECDGNAGRGWAVDIGTTTVAISSYSLSDGKPLSAECFENPQRAYGSDVISRIDYCSKHGVNTLRELIRNAVDSRTALWEKRVITGNTVMLSIFAGVDPSPIGRSPYKAGDLFGRGDGFDYYPRCLHGYAGADLMCSVLYSGMCDSNEISLLTDIGTNGETALWDGHRLLCCSVAAGPCFEGACMSHGMTAVSGAIDRVYTNGNDIVCGTIGGKAPKGFCGSGITDLVAALLKTGKLKADGSMENDFTCGDALFTKADVHEVMLAKAAVAAGIRLLLRHAGVRESDVKRFYLAGGFGNCINPASASEIGMIPREFVKNARPLGNAAASGAAMQLLSVSAQKKAAAITAAAEYVDLTDDAEFGNTYIDMLEF